MCKNIHAYMHMYVLEEHKKERKNANEKNTRKKGKNEVIFYSILITKLYCKSNEEKKEGNPKAQKEKRK